VCLLTRVTGGGRCGSDVFESLLEICQPPAYSLGKFVGQIPGPVGMLKGNQSLDWIGGSSNVSGARFGNDRL